MRYFIDEAEDENMCSRSIRAELLHGDGDEVFLWLFVCLFCVRRTETCHVAHRDTRW